MSSPVTAALPVPALRLERLRVHCQALEPIRLPFYSGSAWRGLLGHSLRRSVCVTRAPTCDGCLLRSHCVYSSFFETPPASPETARRYSALPHPFVLEPPPAGEREHAPGEPLNLGLTLIGPAGDLLPYLIHALQRAGERGLGREGGRFRLCEVTQETQPGSDDWQSVYQTAAGTLQALRSSPPNLGPCPEPLELELLTPLRLKQRGRYVRPDAFDARALLGSLAARVELLAELYGTGQESPATGDRSALHAAIDRVELEPTALRWVDWTRYSSRQRTHMQLGGLLGTVRLSGPGLSALWPLIALGQWLHLGKSTSFGLGRYRILETAPPAP